MTRPAQNEVARLAGTHPITQTPPAKPVRGPGEFRPANIQPRPGQLVWELGQRLGHTFRSEHERVPLTLTFRENGGIEIHLVDQAGGVVGVRGTWWADERGTLNVVGATEGPGPWRLKPNAANDSYELEHDGLKQVFVPTKLPPDG